MGEMADFANEYQESTIDEAYKKMSSGNIQGLSKIPQHIIDDYPMSSEDVEKGIDDMERILIGGSSVDFDRIFMGGAAGDFERISMGENFERVNACANKSGNWWDID